MKLKTKVIIIVLVAVLVLITGGLFFAGNYLYNLALNNATDKSIIFANPNTSNETEIKAIKDNFFATTPYRDVYVTNEDNLKLHSYEFDQGGHDYAIVVHGYTSQGNLMSSSAQEFYLRGYNVLVPDLRGHGTSEGNYIAMGWLDRLDIIKWIDYLVAKDPKAKIILYCVSMGATTVMNVTGEKLPENVVLAIEDCGYTSTWDVFAYQLDELFGLPSHPFLDVANIVTKIKAGYFFSEGNALEQLKNSTTPTLFIHGDEDKFVPYEMLEELYQAAKCPKDKLIIKGAGHAQSDDVDKIRYWQTIDKFIKTYKN